MDYATFFVEALKAVLLAILEGVTEWLPVSSTGHLILLDEVLQLQASEAFRSMFFVLIQLGAILAVILLYWERIWPFSRRGGKVCIERPVLVLWSKILLASLPAGVIGVLLDDWFDAHFYNPLTVGIMLLVIALLFLWVERPGVQRPLRYETVASLPYGVVFAIGCWQLLAAALPGTSRSGATIVGALLLGVSRAAATEFTFYLAIPAMLGASSLKLLKFGFHYSALEGFLLVLGFAVAFLVSLPVIRYFLRYVKQHSFRPFAYYRIALAVVVLGVYFLR